MWTAENTYQMIKQILYNCEADCTVLIRKPQVISGGVRTPCTLPLDPPLVPSFAIILNISSGGLQFNLRDYKLQTITSDDPL